MFFRALLLTVLIGCFGIASLSAQTPDHAAPASAPGRTLLDLYRTGGFVMHPLAAASVAAVAIAAYLQITLARARLLPPEEVAAYSAFLGRREVAEAHRYARERTSLLSRAMAAALVRADLNRDLGNKAAMEQAAADALYHEEGRLLSWVNYLNVISTLAPMLGLLGTVTGMISAFEQLKGGQSSPNDLAGGIGEAMVATATGLVLAIPAMFFFFHYRNLLTTSVADVGQRIGRLLELFSGEANAAGHRLDGEILSEES